MHEQDFSETVRLFYVDSEQREFNALVLSCTANADAKTYNVVLDRTLFFPEGGGQSGDVGTLGTANVIDTKEKSGKIIHICDSPLEEGSRVEGKLNWEVRYDRMQQHSAEHIVSGLICQRFGYQNVGFHVGEDKTTLDFNGPLTAAEVAEIEVESNRVIYQRLPIQTMFPTKEEEAELEYRSKIDIAGQVRIVYIEGVDMCACCAPHVYDTGEIGMIKIVDASAYKGGMRLSIVCGLRALKDYNVKAASVRAISEMLSSPQLGIEDSVGGLKTLSDARKGEIIFWQGKYTDALKNAFKSGINASNSIIVDGELLVHFEEEIDSDVARRFVNDIVEAFRIAATFIGDDNKGYHYIICSSGEEASAFANEMNAALSGKGGGRGNQVQGSVAATREQIETYFRGIK